MFIAQSTITSLSPALVRALRSTLYTSSIKDRYAVNVENTLRGMGESRMADWLKREAEACADKGGDEARMTAELASVADSGLYDLSREYTDPLA